MNVERSGLVLSRYHTRSRAFQLGGDQNDFNTIGRPAGKWEAVRDPASPPLLPGLRGFRLSGWGKLASADDFERAARGLATATTSEDQIQHLRIFSRRQFPFDPELILSLSSSDNSDVAYAAAVALSNIRHPSVRAEAFRLASNGLAGHEWAITMLDQNWEPNDHQIVLNWFERELDRDTRHRMQSGIEAFWNTTRTLQVSLVCCIRYTRRGHVHSAENLWLNASSSRTR